MNRPLLNLAELLVHHYNEASAMSRAAAAEGFGLKDPYQYAHPYPGSTNNLHLNIFGDWGRKEKEKPMEESPKPPADAPKGKKSPWLPIATAALLAAGGTGLAAWLLNRPVGPDAKQGQSIVYEVYERVGEEPWQKSALTVEQLLGKESKLLK